MHPEETKVHRRGQAAAFFSEPEIDHFVMAITSAEVIVRHTAPRPWLSDFVSQIT
jgi:hypothetical protein